MKIPVSPILFSLLLLFPAGISGEKVLSHGKKKKTDYTHLKESLSKFIGKTMEENGITGLSIALTDGSERVWAAGFGFAHREKGIPADADTVYRAGSISKLFTATGVMQLAERGKIGIHEPVSLAVPGIQIRTRFRNAQPVTISHLLTHESGLTSFHQRAFNPDVPIGFGEITGIINSVHTVYPPGFLYLYSNLGYELLGLALRERSGMKFNSFMTRNIFAPLGMGNSSFLLTERIKSRLSGSYLMDHYHGEKGWKRPVPSGSLYSSVNDLAGFMIMVNAGGICRGRRILKRSSLDRMLSPRNSFTPLDPGRRMGFGWKLGRRGLDYAGRVCYHDGWVGHFFSMLIVLPDHGLGVVVLTNSMEGSSIIEMIADRTLREALSLKTGLSPPPEEERRSCAGSGGKETGYRKIKGLYTMGYYGLGFVRGSGRDLSLTFGDEEYRLIPCGGGFFALKRIICGFIPGKRLEMRIKFLEYRGERFILADRGGEVGPLGREYGKVAVNRVWAERAGVYVTTQGKNRFARRLEYRNGVLYWGEYVSVPVNDTEMVLRGFERNYGGETVYAKRSGEGEFLDHRGIVFVKR